MSKREARQAGRGYGIKAMARRALLVELAIGLGVSELARLASGGDLISFFLWFPALPLFLAVIARALILCYVAARSSRDSARAGSPWPKMGFSGAARYVAFNTWCALAAQWWRMPFGSNGSRQQLAEGKPLAVLAPGYLCDGAALSALRRRLEKEGFQVATANYGPPFVSIERFAAQLDRVVREALARSGQSKALVVGHSMGGLVARRWMLDGGASCVSALLTLGSPHAGTERASTGLGECSAQMLPGSEFLQALESDWLLAPRLPPCASLWSEHDNIVAPNHSSRLSRAFEIKIKGVGHLALLFHPRALDAAMKFCLEARRLVSLGAGSQESRAARGSVR